MTDDNPFVVTAYRSPQLFCDREREAAAIMTYNPDKNWEKAETTP